MKSLFNFPKVIAICVALMFAVSSLHAYSPHERAGTKTELKVKGFNLVDVSVTVAHEVNQLNFAFSVADAAANQVCTDERYFTYLKPVNDAKPDNTNIQIWRSKTLNLNSVMRDC